MAEAPELAKDPGPAVLVEPMTEADWLAVRAIYGEGIATGNATFETVTPPWERWDAAHRKECRLVARDGLQVIGWAALSPVSTREVYAGVAEVSVYVAAVARGRKVGSRLLEGLVQASENAGVWTLQAGIFSENTASVRLHKGQGFRVVGGPRARTVTIQTSINRCSGAWTVRSEEEDSCFQG